MSETLARADGPEGTQLYVSDPGEGTNVVRIGATDKTLFFQTRDTNGDALFVKDDERSAPRRLSSVDLSALSYGCDLLFFNRDDRSLADGRSVEGTYSLGGPAYQAARVISEFLLFTKRTATGKELWKTAGTRAGTRFVAGAPKDLDLYAATSLDGAIFFTANTNSFSAWELWRSDGTPEGTRLVKTAPVTGSPSHSRSIPPPRHIALGQ